MPTADLTLERWCALDQKAAELLAAAVGRAVGGESLGVQWPRSHAPAMRVARIAVGGIEFVLVPGGPARLGFDANRFEPTDRVASAQRPCRLRNLDARDEAGGPTPITTMSATQVTLCRSPGAIERGEG